MCEEELVRTRFCSSSAFFNMKLQLLVNIHDMNGQYEQFERTFFRLAS